MRRVFFANPVVNLNAKTMISTSWRICSHSGPRLATGYSLHFRVCSLSTSASTSNSSTGSNDGSSKGKKVYPTLPEKPKNVNVLKSLDLEGDRANKSRFEVDELKRVAETTLGEQKQLLSQKWDEVKTGWIKDKTEKEVVSAVEEESTQEW